MIGKEFVISFLRHYSDSGDFVIHKDMTSSVEFAMKIAELLTAEKKRFRLLTVLLLPKTIFMTIQLSIN